MDNSQNLRNEMRYLKERCLKEMYHYDLLWHEIGRLQRELAMSKRIQCLECGFSAPLYASSDEPNPIIEHRKICTYHQKKENPSNDQLPNKDVTLQQRSENNVAPTTHDS